MTFTLANRAQKMNPSVIREILKVTDRRGIISFAGGLPSAQTFPVDALRQASDKVLRTEGRSALQYAASEGLPALREWVAQDLLAHQCMRVSPEQVLITTGSQQGLDLLAKVLIDAGSPILVESPTYLGALQAFAPMEPVVHSVACDEQGPVPEDLRATLGELGQQARLMYLLPNFQNPTGRTMGEDRRQELVKVAQDAGLPLIEDNPYGDLWFDQAPPASLSSRCPEASVYLGSFSKILAPGLRLGYVAAPPSIYPKLLQAKQAADLHTPSFNQRLVAEVLQGDFMARHVPTIRVLYKQQCQAMLSALAQEMNGLGVRWNRPLGGMFLWLELPKGMDAAALLPHALARGVAFVPGEAFFAAKPVQENLRLSFTTADESQISAGVSVLAQVIAEHLPR